MTQDISRNVVAILLVLTIAIAGIGTYAAVTDEPTVPSGGSAADVSLDIQGPSTGDVSLVIGETPTEDTP